MDSVIARRHAHASHGNGTPRLPSKLGAAYHLRMQIYQWTRFWCPRGKAYALSDDGYLSDPHGEYGKYLNPHPAPLDGFDSCPCVVMLGEPGIGKSTEFDADCQRTERTIAATGEQILRVDLKEYQTDSRLVADTFNGPAFREWAAGTHVLHLYFDSLDEGRLELSNLASILAGQLRRITLHAQRLRLRLACRTAEWPPSLESALRDIWGQEGVSVVELLPLRRSDVLAAAQTEAVSPERFLVDVAEKALQPFASNPITLRFLLELHKNAGELPATKYELYEKGCLRLCQELSQSRRDAGYLGQLTAEQRLEVAGRIAAIAVFSDRPVIDTGPGLSNSRDVATVPEMAGGFELAREDRFAVSEGGVRETSSTTLFSGRGPESLGFAHRTYAEFLAARYLWRRHLDERQVTALLFHSEDQMRVVPQLAETAAWVAIRDKRIFDRIIVGDPQVLLRSDVASADNTVKHELVEAILRGLQTGQFDDSDWELRRQYHKLSHPGLASQIGPVLLDKNQNVVTRRFAADIIEACSVVGSLGSLIHVALDEAEDHAIRAQAAHAIVAIGDNNAIGQLKPLALGSSGSDSDDQLRGTALRGLWPRGLLTAEELFTTLTRAQRQSFFGAYRHFLTHELGSHLRPEHLPEALRWCTRTAEVVGPRDEFEDATAAILTQSLSRLSTDVVREPFAAYILSRVSLNREIPISNGDFASIKDAERRSLMLTVVPKLDDLTGHRFELTVREPRLIQAHDLGWLLEQAEIATTQDSRKWAQLARFCFLSTQPTGLETILKWCESNPIGESLFGDLFLPVALGSDEAKRLRAEHLRYIELEKESRIRHEPPLLDPPPAERVKACLDQFEGGRLNAWAGLNSELQLGPRSTHYLHDLHDDLTAFPGWTEIDDETKRRMVAAAKQYLMAWDSRPDDWLGARIVHFEDFAGYRALLIVESFDPDFLHSLSAERWANVAPAILGFPTSSGFGIESEEAQRRLAGVAYAQAPDAVIAAIVKLIDRENADEQSHHLYILQRVGACWDEKLAKRLFEKAQDRALNPTCLGELLAELIRHGCVEAVAYAQSLVVSRDTPESRKYAHEAAVILWLNDHDKGWSVLWPQFETDRAFFREVIADAVQRGGFHHLPTALSEQQLADLFVMLSQEFPQELDSDRDGAVFVGRLGSVQSFRDGILSLLSHRGTLAACSEIERIRAAVPGIEHLDWVARSARRTMLQSTWTPLTINQARELTQRPGARLVRGGRDLQQVVLESIKRLEKRLHGETPAARDVWDYLGDEKWKPVDENAFSDYIKRHLDVDLKSSGIVALREVEIRRGYDKSGERTDLYVAAVRLDEPSGSYETFRVILEVKGCWHPELTTAMKSQLKDRYLKDNDCEYGMYVVGWFVCNSWSTSDPRWAKTPNWTIDAARAFFDEQKRQLSDEQAVLESLVVDASLT